MPELLVSVVVPTHDRPQRLARLLSALRAQTLAADRFEVILVDDGSALTTRELIARELERAGPAIRALRHPEARGPGAARNSGWRSASAPLVAFTDDDCVPSPEWLATALDALRPRTFVQGMTEPDPAELGANRFLARTVSVAQLGPQYETCNIFYPRAALEALGGFDERFGLRPGGEDTDLAWRALAAGWQGVFAPQAIVFHAVEQLGIRGRLNEAARWSATVRVFADHPAARSMLYRGLFWNVWHYLLWRSLLAMLAPPWLRRLLIGRHLRALRRRAAVEGGRARWIPFLVLYDLVECWSVARGAVRHRTLVL